MQPSVHSGQPSILGQRTVGTTKTRIEILGYLNEPIRVASIFSLWPRYTESDGTRHVVPSRSSGFRDMWLVASLSRIHLSLRSCLMSLLLWAHAFHDSTEEFSQWCKSQALIICLTFLGKSFGVFLCRRNVIEACSMPPRVRISWFVTAALRSMCCQKPWVTLTPDIFLFAPKTVFSGEINR